MRCQVSSFRMKLPEECCGAQIDERNLQIFPKPVQKAYHKQRQSSMQVINVDRKANEL